ncbi:hypothetical protein N665_1324s0002 [Sinapis alba]|nr:hypothetical protein N665_1324s0002 [Sinapis alba]
MTNHGAIPTSSHTSPSPVIDVESPSSNNQCNTCTMRMPRRPWGVMFDIHSMGLPHDISDASSRFKTNYNYFRMNYVILVSIIILIAIFGSLLKHPCSLIAFTVLVFIFIFLFNLQDHDHDEPIELLCFQISDWLIRIVKSFLIVLTIVLLILTNATYMIFGRPLVIGYVLILIHTVVRKTEDLFLDEESATATTETCWNSLPFHVMLALFNLYLSFG